MSPSELSVLPPSSSPAESPTFQPEEFPPSSTPTIAPTTNPPAVSSPPQSHDAPGPSPVSSPHQTAEKHSKSKLHIILIWARVLRGTMLVSIAALGVIFFRSSSVVTVKSWVTGLSGQLQNAFVTGASAEAQVIRT